MGNEAEEQKRGASEKEDSLLGVDPDQRGGRFVYLLPDHIVQRKGGRPKSRDKEARILAIRAAFCWRTLFIGDSPKAAYNWISEHWEMRMYQDEGNVRRHLAEAKKIAGWGMLAKHAGSTYYVLARNRTDEGEGDGERYPMPDISADGWLWKPEELQVVSLPEAGRFIVEGIVRQLKRDLEMSQRK